MSSSLAGYQGQSKSRIWERIVGAMKGACCAICLTPEIKVSEAVVLESCLHSFCDPCITAWSIKKPNKPTCPMCRCPMRGWYFGFDFTSQTHCYKILSDYMGAPGTLVLIRHNPVIARRDLGDDMGRILEWRRSVYRDGLRAVPESTLNHLRHEYEDMIQELESYNGVLLQLRAGFWVRRELHALRPDLDNCPDTRMHIISLAATLFSENWRHCPYDAGLIRDGDDFLDPLRPFFFNCTNVLWHEITCYALSPLETMDIYDAVVDYQPYSIAGAD